MTLHRALPKIILHVVISFVENSIQLYWWQMTKCFAWSFSGIYSPLYFSIQLQKLSPHSFSILSSSFSFLSSTHFPTIILKSPFLLLMFQVFWFFFYKCHTLASIIISFHFLDCPCSSHITPKLQVHPQVSNPSLNILLLFNSPSLTSQITNLFLLILHSFQV